MASNKDFERQSASQSNEMSEEKSIQSSNFGGLNTTVNPLNVPYSDTPYTVNTIIDVDGSIKKRKGTSKIIEYGLSESFDFRATKSSWLSRFVTNNNYNFVIQKVQNHIFIFELIDNKFQFFMVKLNVWTDAAKNVTPTSVSTSEIEPRMIICTGVNRPVQLLWQECQAVNTTPSATSVTINNVSRFVNTNIGNAYVYINRIRYTGTPTFTFTPPSTLAITGLPSLAVGDVVDVVKCTWQHWAEAQVWTGKDFYSSSTRFNAVAADQNVAIPVELLTDLEPNRKQNNYNITARKKSTRTPGTTYTRSSTFNPSTSDEFAFGNGSVYIPAVDNYVTPSTPFFVTFGALQAGGQPSDIYFSRRRVCRYFNGTPIQAQYIKVWLTSLNELTSREKDLITLGGSAPDLVYGNFWTFNNDTGANGLSTTDLVHGIYFEAATTGIPQTSIVESYHYNTFYIGSAAIPIWVYSGTGAEYTGFLDGMCHFAYGLGDYADYQNGYFPSSVSFFQGRIVFSGFQHRPLTVLFSEVEDATVPTRFYSSFTVSEIWQGEQYAFDLTINSSADDYVVHTVEWQNNLFALTRNSVFRVFGTNSILTQNSKASQFVSNVGCVNAACVARTDLNVLYLSDNGLYDLQPRVENGDYVVTELSIKIRDKFGITNNPDYELMPWVSYSSYERLLYIGYPALGDKYTCRKIYIFNTYRESWSEYDTPGAFQTWSGAEVIDRIRGKVFMCSCNNNRDGAGIPINTSIIVFNYDKYLDYCQTRVHDSLPYTPVKSGSVAFTATAGQKIFYTDYERNQLQGSFSLVPPSDIRDVAVYKNSVLQVFGTDYIKYNSAIVFLSPMVGGESVSINCCPQLDNSNITYGVYVNNVKITSPSLSGGTFTVSTINGNTVEWGNYYYTVFTTPQFVYGDLTRQKRGIRFHLLFDNRNAINSSYPLSVNAKTSYFTDLSYNGSDSNTGFSNDSVYYNDNVILPESNYNQGENYQLFSSYYPGVGYSFALQVWNYDESYFKLISYQVEAKLKGRSSQSW